MPILRLIAILCFVLTSFVTGAVLYGKNDAGLSDLQTFGFDVCNDRPCFLGVTTGMAWNDAQILLSERKELSVRFDNNLIILRIRSIDIAVRPDADHKYVQQIYFKIWSDVGFYPRLGSVIGLYGAPCSVILIPWGKNFFERIIINYPYLSLSVEGINPRANVWEVSSAYNPPPAASCAGRTVNGLIINQWEGFRRFRYYTTER
jgi:hypothetical protein